MFRMASDGSVRSLVFGFSPPEVWWASDLVSEGLLVQTHALRPFDLCHATVMDDNLHHAVLKRPHVLADDFQPVGVGIGR